jgi:hypothetical protein
MISVLGILAIILLSNPKRLLYSIFAVLNLSPLFFAIFFLGYISGTTWQSDFFLIGKIAVLVCFTTILVRTTSAFAFLKNIRGLLPQRLFDGLIIYIYGIINFFPILHQQFSDTTIAYKLQKGRKIRLSDIPQLFPALVEKSLYQVRDLNLCADTFTTSNITFDFTFYDIIIFLVITFQFLLFLL